MIEKKLRSGRQYTLLLCQIIYYFASAAVDVDSRQTTVWSRFSAPSNFVNGYVLTVWFTVCHWPQSQEGVWARPHLSNEGMRCRGRPRKTWNEVIVKHCHAQQLCKADAMDHRTSRKSIKDV